MLPKSGTSGLSALEMNNARNEASGHDGNSAPESSRPRLRFQAIKAQETINQIATRLHPHQVTQWNSSCARLRLALLLNNQESVEGELYEQID